MGQKSDTAASSCVACRAAAHLAAQEPRQHTSGGGTARQRKGSLAWTAPPSPLLPVSPLLTFRLSLLFFPISSPSPALTLHSPPSLPPFPPTRARRGQQRAYQDPGGRRGAKREGGESTGKTRGGGGVNGGQIAAAEGQRKGGSELYETWPTHGRHRTPGKFAAAASGGHWPTRLQMVRARVTSSISSSRCNRLCARSTSMEHVLRSKGSSPVLSRAVSVSGAMVARSAKHPGDSAPLSTRNEECCRQRGMLSLEN